MESAGAVFLSRTDTFFKELCFWHMQRKQGTDSPEEEEENIRGGQTDCHILRAARPSTGPWEVHGLVKSHTWGWIQNMPASVSTPVLTIAPGAFLGPTSPTPAPQTYLTRRWNSG